jgi:hypothetical protein
VKAPRTASPIAHGLVVAGLIIAASIALALASPEYVSDTLARRLLGGLLGVMVVLYANQVPKALTPLARLRCDPAKEQALRRFAGWALLVGGLGYATAWMFAPIASARLFAIAALGSALLLVVVRYGLVMGHDKRDA